MSILLAIFRQLGLAGSILLVGYVFYEGAPVLRDIPYIDRVPAVRELLAGRVATEVAKERAKGESELAAARKGYVLETELMAAQARAAEIERQRNASAIALEEYRKRAVAAAEMDRIAQEQMEKAIAQDTGDDGSHWTDDDRNWLCSQRQAQGCGSQ